MKHAELTNEELLALYKDLDGGAFDEFFRRNSRTIFSFIASRLQNNSEAEEVLQDTFFRLHRYILKYDSNQNAMSWTFAIAKNCILDQIAKRKKLSELKAETEKQYEMESIEATFQKVAREQLKHLLSGLSTDDRKLLEQRFLNEASYNDLAKAQGMTSAGVRQRISRIVRKLRENL